MRRNVAMMLGIVVVFATICSVGAYSGQGIKVEEEEEFEGKRVERPFGLYGPYARQYNPDRVEEMASAAFEKNGQWLLEPRNFERLSGAGQRAALRMYGQLEKPTRGNRGILMPLYNRTVKPQAGLNENMRVNDPLVDRIGATQSESHVAVNGSTVIVGFNDSGLFDGTIDGGGFTSYAVSTDGGNTFAQKQLPKATNGGLSLGDPVIAFGPNNEIYFASLIATTTRTQIGVAKSVDNGNTFAAPVIVSTGGLAQDKEWLAVDTGANSPFRGNVYVSWFEQSPTIDGRGELLINFARSTNGGSSFEPAVAISARETEFIVQGPMPAIAPNGDIYVAYEDQRVNGVSIVKSTDGGRTFSAPRRAAMFNTYTFEFFPNGDGYRSNSFPSIAVDRNNVVHIVFGAVPAIPGQDRSDIFYVRSTDGGATFSAPRKINDDNTTASQLLPALAAAADGTVGVRWWDRRNDPVNDTLTDVYMAVTTDGGNSFSKNFRITDTNWPFGPNLERSIRVGYHGDYDALATAGNNFFVSWSDERGTDPDVFLAQVPVDRNANAPDFNISAMRVYDSVIAGQSLDLGFTTRGDNGFNGTLSLSASPDIPGISYGFASASVAAGQPANLKITTAASVVPGNYLIHVSATGGGLTRRTTFRITVFEPNRQADAPINITRSAGFTVFNGGLKIDGSGMMHIAFDDDTSVTFGGNNVFYAQSFDNGRTFSQPVKISTNGNFSFSEVLEIDGQGNIYIVYATLSANGQSATIFFSRSTDGGRTFSTPVPLSPDAQAADLPAIAVDKSGNIMITYVVFGETNARVMAVRSTDKGASFSAPVRVSGDNEDVSTPGYVAFDSAGAAYVVYTEASDTIFAVNMAIAPDGQRFNQPRVISDRRIAASFAPHLAFDKDDNLYVSFYNILGATIQTRNREIIVVKSTNRGASFSPQLNISRNTGQSVFPFVIPDVRGGVTVVWQDTTNTELSDILCARSSDGGVTFSAPANLSTNFGNSVGAAGAADSQGNVFIAWNDTTAANPEVFLAPIFAVRPQPPVLSALSPASRAVGGDITITGSSLQIASAVTFAPNIVVPRASFTAVNSTQIVVNVPQGAVSGPVSVTTALGNATSPAPLTIIGDDFSTLVAPASQTIASGQSATFSISAQALGGFNQAINLGAAVAPAGTVTATLSSASVMPGGTANLTVTAPATTAPGSFTVTLTGSAGQLTRTRTVVVNVVAPDFSLALTPAQLTVLRGDKGTITVAINRTGGFAGNVTVTAPDTKPIKVKLTPPNASTTGNSVNFTFKIKPKASAGARQITFTGRDESGRVRTATLNLTIQ